MHNQPPKSPTPLIFSPCQESYRGTSETSSGSELLVNVSLFLVFTIDAYLFILLVAFFGVESVVAEHLKQAVTRTFDDMFRHLVVDVGVVTRKGPSPSVLLLE